MLCMAVLYVSVSWACLGVRCCIYICGCTVIHNAHFQVLFSLGVSQNEEGYNATVFNKYNCLLQFFIPITTIP